MKNLVKSQSANKKTLAVICCLYHVTAAFILHLVRFGLIFGEETFLRTVFLLAAAFF